MKNEENKLITINKQNKALTENIKNTKELLNSLLKYDDEMNNNIRKRETTNNLKQIRIIKSDNPNVPYRIKMGNVDCTPFPFKRKKQHFKVDIDLNDFASLFYIGNFIPTKLPLFFYDDTIQLITGVITGTKYKYGAFPLEHILKKVCDRPQILNEKVKTDRYCVKPSIKIDQFVSETFKIRLQETKTFKIISLNSVFIDPDPEPFKFIAEQETRGNIIPIFHTVVKSLEQSPKNISSNTNIKSFFPNCYDVSIATCTHPVTDKAIVTDRIELNHQSIHVFPSDFYDSFQIFDEYDDGKSDNVNEFDPHLCNADYLNISNNVLESHEFNDIFNIIERMLATNYHHETLSLYVNARFLDDVERNYTLTPLLVFKLPKTYCINRTYEVTTLAWHPWNKYLLAIGYGTLHKDKLAKGIISLWNLKNSTFPERLYKFHHRVKCLAFTSTYPYTITVGFSDGHVAVVNILAKKLIKLYDTSNFSSINNSPMTHLSWFNNNENNFLLTSHESGVIYHYNLARDFIPELFLDLPRKFGPIKGIKQYGSFQEGVDKMKIRSAITVFTQYPVEPNIYLVGTFDGYIYICSTLYRSKVKNIFTAHEGPIFNIEFNPMCNNLFLTTGCDYFIKIWSFGVFKPLISYSARKEFLRYAKWHPFNAMILIGLSEMYIDVWDLRRINDRIPITTYESPDRVSFLTFNMSPFGRHLLVGDANGQVNLFLLNEMDNEPKYKIDLLARALYNHVSIRDTSLWEKVEDQNPEFKINDINE